MIIDNINPHYEIRVKDIDPDTGEVCRDWPIAIAMRREAAGGIVNALNIADEEPNRSYYMIHRDMTINC